MIANSLIAMLNEAYAEHTGDRYVRRDHRVWNLHMQAYLMAGYEEEPVNWYFENDVQEDAIATMAGWVEHVKESMSEVYYNGKKRFTFLTDCRGDSFVARLTLHYDREDKAQELAATEDSWCWFPTEAEFNRVDPRKLSRSSYEKPSRDNE